MLDTMPRTWKHAAPFVALLCLVLSGCQQEMAKQPNYRPLEQSSFFPDGRASRPLLPGTVAQNHLRDDPLLYEGKDETRQAAVQTASLFGMSAGNLLGAATVVGEIPNGFDVLEYTNVFPFKKEELEQKLARGQQRYMIFCVVCHDPAGNGNGKIVQRGYTKPPSYITDRSRGLERRGFSVLLQDAPVGYFFEVASKGYGAMPDYSSQVPVEDRWAIIAYIRALQLAGRAPVDKLPKEDQEALKAVEKQ